MDGYRYIKKFLKDHEIAYTDKNGVIFFNVNRTCYFTNKVKSSPYLSLVLPCEVGEQPRDLLLQTCNELNLSYRVIKFIVPQGSSMIYCAYEILPDPSTITEEIITILTLLDSATNDLFARLGLTPTP